MKNRENRGAPSADLLACFPSRAHLALLPKPICSPARSSEPTKRHPHHRRKMSAGGGMFGGAGQLSPVPWAKSSKQIKPRDNGGRPESSEPTSPKVTCAGQIKARPSGQSGCRNWESVMEEIERIHSDRKQRTLGFKKEVMQFLTCLRSIKFDFNFRCLGSFPGQAISSDDDEDEEEVEEDDEKKDSEALEEDSGTVFSKWFTVLEEDEKKIAPLDDEGAIVVPPANALLLMRCRSAPAQSRLKRRETEDEDGDLQELKEEEEDDDDDDNDEEEAAVDNEESRRKKKRESLEMVMKFDSDFYKLGSDDEIAKETWVDGGLMEALCRSRSCKR